VAGGNYGKYNTTGVLKGPSGASGAKADEASPEIVVTAAEISKLDALQMLLDVVGLIPGLGAPADILNAIISGARGDWLGAGLSLVGVVPVAGEAATAGKIAKNSEKYAAAVAKVADEVLPYLPKRVQDKLRPAIDAAKKKIDELGGKKPKAEPEVPPKAKDEGTDGKKVKPKKKMKCGESGTYGDLKKKTGEGKFDRDHIPSKAALKARAKALQRGKLSKAQEAAIDKAGSAIAIPRQAHVDVSPTYGQTAAEAARDSKNLAGSAKRDVEATLSQIDQYDEDGSCRKAYQTAADKIMQMDNADYDRMLLEILKGAK
jgi:hypothetical protein